MGSGEKGVDKKQYSGEERGKSRSDGASWRSGARAGPCPSPSYASQTRQWWAWAVPAGSDLTGRGRCDSACMIPAACPKTRVPATSRQAASGLTRASPPLAPRR